MRRVLVAFVLFAAASMQAQEAPVPQAVKALEHLKTQPSISRLKNATLRGPDLSSLQTQSFNYDEYGNLTGTSKLGQTVSLLTSTDTNQLNTLHYDAAGNVDVVGTQHYAYDAVGMLNTVTIATNDPPRIIYAYTADDERLFAYDPSAGITHWTLRGLDNKVLRDFKQVGPSWSVDRDYVYREGLLLAALTPTGAEHYSLDHLGTPRLITDAAGHRIGYHVYWPFGEEWSSGNGQEGNPLKFTGHERDAALIGGAAAYDYMHARYYGSVWGRFLSVDPVLDEKNALANPQLWNRYTYAVDNPIGRVDPDGRLVQLRGTQQERLQALELIKSNLREQDRKYVTINSKGIVSVSSRAKGGLGLQMLRQLARKDVQTVTVGLSSTVQAKRGPGPSPAVTLDIQAAAGGGATVRSALSMSGNIEVTVDPRGSLGTGASASLVMGHELLGHAWDRVFKGTTSERSAVTTESNLLRQMGMPPFRPVPTDHEHP
jgi:RHS repeat-associated protein